MKPRLTAITFSACSSTYYGTMEKFGVYKCDIFTKCVEAARDAQDLDERIQSIEHVATDLFAEWEDELDEYSNTTLRADSQRQLRSTQRAYQYLIRTMKNVQSRIPPVFNIFHDQVFYLKHNVRAIAALQGEYHSMQNNINRLLKELDASICEANQFINPMKTDKKS